MKNIHLLPTDKPSRLFLKENTLLLNNQYTLQKIFTKGKCQNIYITSDEEIKEGDYFIGCINGITTAYKHKLVGGFLPILDSEDKKIILTTDPELIKDGVQAIDDTFLEWFVKNPSCEEVEVDSFVKYNPIVYQIILPKPKQECLHQESRFRDYYKDGCYKCWECGKIVVEEPKQETIEQAANTIYPNDGFKDEYYVDLGEVFREKFIEGAKWQAERMYSEEDMINFHKWAYQKNRIEESDKTTKELLKEWFEQFKKK